MFIIIPERQLLFMHAKKNPLSGKEINMSNTEKVWSLIDQDAAAFESMSDQIWGFAEFRFQEFKSSKLQKEYLKNEGFTITEKIANMDTAFMAEWGEGGPLIGILGEFDALPDLAQHSDCLEKNPIEGQKYGHGCGHNLLGTAAVEACVAVKKYLEETGLKGRIRFYATPAEEGASAKTFMLREGCFLDLDICISWHPDSENSCGGNTLSMIRAYFNFHGKSAHAAASPHLGRSALDAVELMDVGSNYLREHIIPEARLHYAITNSGGVAPNTVQGEAEVCYNIRAPRNQDMLEIYERLQCVAKGAAMMTGTTVDVRPVSYYANFLDNVTLNKLTEESMKQMLRQDYTEEELAYAKKFQPVLPENGVRHARENALRYGGEHAAEIIDGPICLYTLPTGLPKSASTDYGNVSWNVPSASLNCACFAAGTALHSWQAVSQGKSSIAHKGMHNAAAVMAQVAVRLFEDPALVDQAKKDFDTARNGEVYRCILPDNIIPGDF